MSHVESIKISYVCNAHTECIDDEKFPRVWALYMDVKTENGGQYRGFANNVFAATKTGYEDNRVDAMKFFREYLYQYGATREMVSPFLSDWWSSKD